MAGSLKQRFGNSDYLAAIVGALEAAAQNLPVVWPLHPRTRGVLQKSGRLEFLSQNLTLIDPVGYLDMVQLEKYAALIATDSGGVQKEAFFYQVPCVTLRDETEWVELVDGGWNRLASPTNAAEVVAVLRAGIGTVGREITPYGAGDAAGKIVQHMLKELN